MVFSILLSLSPEFLIESVKLATCNPRNASAQIQPGSSDFQKDKISRGGIIAVAMREFIINAPRWLLLAALVFAPWAYGSTPDSTIEILNILFAIILVLWIAACAVRRSWPAIHPLPLIASALLVLQAWWMMLNAKTDYDANALHFVEASPLIKFLPGSLDKTASLAMAVRMSMLLAIGCLCCDITRQPIWRKRLLWTMALTGLSLVLLGLIQRFTGAAGIFWGPANQGETFFATYRYHANAGAFLNMIWPIAGALALIGFRKRTSIGMFWSGAFVLALIAVFVNASRAANVLAIALLLIGVVGFMKRPGGRASSRAGSSGASPSQRAITPAALVTMLLVAVIILASVAALGGLDTTFRRWGKFKQELSLQNERLVVAKVCLQMIPKAGLCGFGPGTFQTAFPYFTNEVGDDISGIWVYAHDDYLQTLIEWGWIGGILWAAYVFGAVVFSGLHYFRNRHELPSSDRIAYAAMIVALIGVLAHAAVDFPLQIASIQLYFVALLGILWSCRSWFERPAPTPHRVAQSNSVPL
jgi:hypothetical protein